MYRPAPPWVPPPLIWYRTRGVGWFSPLISGTSNPASGAWLDNNDQAIYTPIVLPGPCVARRVWWANGATTTGGATIEVGLYADSGYGPGAKLFSGSATQGTASQVQFVDVTDTALAPGLYWVAISSSSGTNTDIFRESFSTAVDAGFRFDQATARPLPATATPVESTAHIFYVCGFATTSSP